MKRKISEKVDFVLGLQVAVMIITAIFGIISFQIIGKNMTTFYNVQYETTKNQMEIRKDVQTINKRILWAIIRKDNQVTKEQLDDFEERFLKIEGYIDVISKNLAGKADGEGLAEAFSNLETDTYKIMKLIQDGRTQEAVDYYDSTFNDVSEVLADALDATGNQSDTDAAGQYENSIAVRIVATVFMLLFSAVSLAAMVILGKRLKKSIILPLGEIEDAAEAIAEGDLHIFYL